MMIRRIQTIALPALLLTAPLAHASTLYRCADESGVVLYTNQKTSQKSCTVLSVQVPPAPGAGAATGKPRTTSTPTPSDFPRVSGNEQKARDGDRRAILDRELATELANLDKARQATINISTLPPERQQALKNTVALHERNIEALKKEIGNLR
jgi:hypothetical protein